MTQEEVISGLATVAGLPDEANNSTAVKFYASQTRADAAMALIKWSANVKLLIIHYQAQLVQNLEGAQRRIIQALWKIHQWPQNVNFCFILSANKFLAVTSKCQKKQSSTETEEASLLFFCLFQMITRQFFLNLLWGFIIFHEHEGGCRNSDLWNCSNGDHIFYTAVQASDYQMSLISSTKASTKVTLITWTLSTRSL